MEEGRRSLVLGLLAAILLLGASLAPLVAAHQGSYGRPDLAWDPQVGLMVGEPGGPAYAGLPCPRTDMVHGGVEALHASDPWSDVSGTQVTFTLNDLSTDCALDDPGMDDTYWYVFEFKPENADWARAWVALDQHHHAKEVLLTWRQGNGHHMVGCYGSCDSDVTVDLEANTVSFLIPDGWVEPPFRQAFFHTELSFCEPTEPRICPLPGSPPRITEHGDLMPNMGRDCYFCGQEPHGA